MNTKDKVDLSFLLGKCVVIAKADEWDLSRFIDAAIRGWREMDTAPSSLTMTDDDQARLAAISEAVADPMTLATLIHAYYADTARADRTPRAVLYFHMGLLAGVTIRYGAPNP